MAPTKDMIACWLADRTAGRPILPLYLKTYPSGVTTTGDSRRALMKSVLPYGSIERIVPEVKIHRWLGDARLYYVRDPLTGELAGTMPRREAYKRARELGGKHARIVVVVD